MNVVKRDGRIEPLNIEKIRKVTIPACDGLDGVSYNELEAKAKITFKDGIKTSDIQKALIQSAIDLIDFDKPNYQYVAARLQLYDLYHNIAGISGYRHLKETLQEGIEKNVYIKTIGNNQTFEDIYDLDELNDYIKPERDLLFNHMGVLNMISRYLVKVNGKYIEAPQHLFMILSMFLASKEKEPMKWAKAFYDMLSKHEVMIATPGLSNGRLKRHQLSSCMVLSTPDNIEGIFKCYDDAGKLSKFGAGLGWDWNLVRGIGSTIDYADGAAGGPIPFLKIANDIMIAVDQLGIRKGSSTVYMEPWNISILNFIDLKLQSGEERERAHDLFLAVWGNDLFYHRASKEVDGIWSLFNPKDVPLLSNTYGEEWIKAYETYEADPSIPRETIKARELWRTILRNLFETGAPFITYKDNANRANMNKHAGIIRSSNLCVTGDTRLATQFGLLTAKELYDMKEKLQATYDKRVDGNLKEYGVSTAECIEMHKTKENADVYEVKLKTGHTIKSTDWHEYYVVRDNELLKLPLKDLVVGDKLLLQSGEGQFGNINEPEIALIIGLITGDGTFSKDVKNNKNINAIIDLYNENLELQKTIEDYVKAIIDKFYYNLDKTKKITSYPKGQIIKHTKNSTKCRIASIALGRILDEYFNYSKDTKLKVPDFIYKANRETMIKYLQGLYSTNGSVIAFNNNNIPTYGIQIASISKELLEGVQIILSNFGIKSTIYKVRDKSFMYDKKYDKNYPTSPLYRLDLNGNNAINYIKKIGFLNNKSKICTDITNERLERGVGEYSRKSENFVSEITSIEYYGKEDVYDTTQLLNHSLIFNGIVTGNCTEIFQNTEPPKVIYRITFEDDTILEIPEEELVNVPNIFSTYKDKRVKYINKYATEAEIAVCNLASINLSKINTNEDFKRIAPIVTRMVDNTIDLNFYPVLGAKNHSNKYRAIGIGVMGEMHMLAKKGIYFGSQEHYELLDEIMETYSYYIIKSSMELAKEKGVYPLYEGSEWSKGKLPFDFAPEKAEALTSYKRQKDWDTLREDIKKNGVRNGYMMAIAPTSSISLTVGTSQAIEPIFKRKWYEVTMIGEVPMLAPDISPETWQYYESAYDIDQTKIIKAGAIRQKYIDQGQSLNIFIKLENADARELDKLYQLGRELGLKSTYYLRGQSVEVSENDTEVMDRSLECTGCQ